MAENSCFKSLSIILFLLSLVANYFVSYIDFRVLFLVSVVLFLGVWGVSWFSFKYYGSLDWNSPKQSTRLRKIADSWRRKARLFPILVKKKYGLCFLLLLSISGAQIYMVELHHTLSESLNYGNYHLSSGECKQTIDGETKIVPVAECEKRFSEFFNMFLKLVAFFAAMNIVLIFIICPLFKHYNVLYNNYEKRT